ncbi:undifferentiated embryonic cell transcription factor 1-like [Dipodomys spectabilis]|uniref:undifferentiated embryonic cell transcription factor 1-like n=1 Tax=Dipodomys spectabilis TaxID=105255 RepID=UPI001C5484CE|nr:undifferentiated embryonic cell transcription factor 1-like [Dipodomys spectabilis]
MRQPRCCSRPGSPSLRAPATPQAPAGPRVPPQPRSPRSPPGCCWPRWSPPLAPWSPTDLVAELLPLAKDVPGTPPRGLAVTNGGLPLWPGAPVSPGSARQEPWSAWETELLLAELLRPAVWRTLPTYRQVSAALALRQVRHTPAQCCCRYKFLKSKVRKAKGQPPGSFDTQIRELMGLLGDNQQDRRTRRSRRPAPSVPAPVPEDPGAAPPWAPANLLPPATTPSLNAALLQTLTHLGDILGMLGPLRDQLLTRNQHVEQLHGSFDQTVSLAVGFILGSMATQRGILGELS